MSTRREPLDPADATKLVLDQMRAVLDNPELSEDATSSTGAEIPSWPPG